MKTTTIFLILGIMAICGVIHYSAAYLLSQRKVIEKTRQRTLLALLSPIFFCLIFFISFVPPKSEINSIASTAFVICMTVGLYVLLCLSMITAFDDERKNRQRKKPR